MALPCSLKYSRERKDSWSAGRSLQRQKPRYDQGRLQIGRRMQSCPTIRTAMLFRKIAGGLVLWWVLAAADTAADWVRQGQAYKAKGDAAAALQAFEKALALDPKSPQIEDEVGFILAATNRRDEAIAHFEKAIQLDARFAPAHYHLGVAYWLGQDPNRSIPELEAAVKLRPADGDYRYRLGSAYNSVGHYEDAVRELREAVKLRPKNAAQVELKRAGTGSGPRGCALYAGDRLLAER